jgi:phage terminase large subunit-like protein
MSDLLSLSNELKKRRKQNSLDLWFGENDQKLDGLTYYAAYKYPRAEAFWEAGLKYNFRIFDGANQTAKTYAVGWEVAQHMTGLYRPHWKGKRLKGPSRWWAASDDNKTTRERIQDRLLGDVDNRGTGLLPNNCILWDSMVTTEKADTPIPTIRVQHYDQDGHPDGISVMSFKSYEQGRVAFQGLPVNVWGSEEPPLEIVSEWQARTTANDELMILIDYTPLSGWTPFITNILPNGWPGPISGNEGWQGPISDSRYMVVQTAWEVPHITEAKRATLEIDYHPHVRDARLRGIPSLGSGAIYPIPKADWVINDIEIPKHYKKIYGLDVGWNWTAAVWFAVNPDDGTAFVYSEHKMSETEPMGHAEVIRTRGLWIPGVIDSAANGRGQDGGETLIQQYRDLGLQVTNANKSVEAGIYAVWSALKAGQLKVFASCQKTINELENYHRDIKGKIVKVNDHICDALRYGLMSIDTAKAQTPTQSAGRIDPRYINQFRR